MIDWFARNSVAANLLMVFLVASGTIAGFNVITEVMPEINLDRIQVEVRYLGAAPEEVEEAVCVRIEEAIYGVDGIKQIVSTASEGMGSVVIELELGADARRVLDDVKGRVDAIDTFPEETEKPIIRELIARHHEPASSDQSWPEIIDGTPPGAEAPVVEVSALQQSFGGNPETDPLECHMLSFLSNQNVRMTFGVAGVILSV